MATKSKSSSTPFARRLSADAWQHVMAGHLADYAREGGRWIFRLGGDCSPYTDDEEGVTDEEFAAVLAGLPAHGQPVKVSAVANGRIDRDENGRWVLIPRKVTEYPELAGGAVESKKAAKVREISSAPSKVKAARHLQAVPVAVAGELDAYVSRLLHAPKKAYAAELVAAVRSGRPLESVGCGELDGEAAGKVRAKVARLARAVAVAEIA